MRYVSRKSHMTQKHKLGIMYSIALFVESVLVPPKHEKYCTTISCPGRTGMHYVIHIAHKMQKHKFGVTCPGALFMETALGPPEHEKEFVTVLCPGCTECTT
jgi:hypothetical protein